MSIQTLLSFFLAMVRIHGFFLVAPIFSRSGIPGMIQVGMSAVIVANLYNFIFENATTVLATDIYHLAIYFVHELVIGFILGMIFNLIFDILTTITHILGIQVGHSSSNLVNPTAGGPVNPVGLFYQNTGLLFFVTFNGLFHIAFMMRKSFEILPMASFHINFVGLAVNFVAIFSEMFVIGLKFVFPMLALLFILDVFVAVFGKILPQANMMFLMMPMKLTLGLVLIVMVMNSYYSGLEEFFTDGIYDLFDRLFLR